MNLRFPWETQIWIVFPSKAHAVSAQLENCIKIQYWQAVTHLTPTQWIAQCTARLGQRWRTVKPGWLEKEEEVLVWQDAALHQLPLAEAAATWSRPVELLPELGGYSPA